LTNVCGDLGVYHSHDDGIINLQVEPLFRKQNNKRNHIRQATSESVCNNNKFIGLGKSRIRMRVDEVSKKRLKKIAHNLMSEEC